MLRITHSWIILATLLVAFGFGLTTSAHADQAGFIKAVDNGGQGDDGWAATAHRGKGDNVAVPEPATMALIGLGMATVGAIRRRRRNNS